MWALTMLASYSTAPVNTGRFQPSTRIRPSMLPIMVVLNLPHKTFTLQKTKTPLILHILFYSQHTPLHHSFNACIPKLNTSSTSTPYQVNHSDCSTTSRLRFCSRRPYLQLVFVQLSLPRLGCCAFFRFLLLPYITVFLSMFLAFF